MNELILLGDSVFDNGAYINGGPDVCHQLCGILPAGWGAKLLAVDGSHTPDVHDQLKRLPDSATHQIISSGGNDALQHLDLLIDSISTGGDTLNIAKEAAFEFQQSYGLMLNTAISRGLPIIAVCTIYNPNFDDPKLQREACSALTFFNKAIKQEASSHRVRVLDLQLIFTQPEDYANPIEPSVIGGAKLADEICRLFLGHNFEPPETPI